MSALRLSLPYHDQRMPPELHRADYIVSANVARTVQVCRQAVLDARRAIAWLAARGLRAHRHPRHEPRIVPRAADDGARAAHPRGGAQSHLAVLRRRRVARAVDASTCARGSTATSSSTCCATLWKPISPRWYLERLRDRPTLLVYARYDLTFPVDLSRGSGARVPRARVPHEVAVLPCGHYSTGKAPFKFVDGLDADALPEKSAAGARGTETSNADSTFDDLRSTFAFQRYFSRPLRAVNSASASSRTSGETRRPR